MFKTLNHIAGALAVNAAVSCCHGRGCRAQEKVRGVSSCLSWRSRAWSKPRAGLLAFHVAMCCCHGGGCRAQERVSEGQQLLVLDLVVLVGALAHVARVLAVHAAVGRGAAAGCRQARRLRQICSSGSESGSVQAVLPVAEKVGQHTCCCQRGEEQPPEAGCKGQEESPARPHDEVAAAQVLTTPQRREDGQHDERGDGEAHEQQPAHNCASEQGADTDDKAGAFEAGCRLLAQASPQGCLRGSVKHSAELHTSRACLAARQPVRQLQQLQSPSKVSAIKARRKLSYRPNQLSPEPGSEDGEQELQDAAR